ncbi:MAG: 50S ribosomal protein L10 [Fimbriimonadaceae bacterium]
MPTAAKAKTIQETQERLQRARGVLFTEYRGLKVKQLQQLRKALGTSSEFQIVKNTLFRLAAGDTAEQFDSEMTNGPTAVAFVYDDEAACAKALVDFSKANPHLVIKGAYLDGKNLSASQVDALGKLPPRDVLLAQLISTVIAPLTQLVGVVEAIYADPIRVVGAVADKVAEGSPIEAKPAAEEPSAEAAPEATAEEPASEAADEVGTDAAEVAAEEPAAEAPAEENEVPTPAEEPAEEAPEA